jgi:hypothetical protein
MKEIAFLSENAYLDAFESNHPDIQEPAFKLPAEKN